MSRCMGSKMRKLMLVCVCAVVCASCSGPKKKLVDSASVLEDIRFNPAHFGYNSADLPEAQMRILKDNLDLMEQYPGMMIQIEGHCDERGSEEYNYRLGQKRADAVKRFFVSKGVDAGRIMTMSMGESMPLKTGGTEEDFAENRRVVFVVLTL